ncbi:unnamed protein product [Acanthoscelides obtectus]|uniref:Tetratricopeptide repeat protein 17 n=1 Tax=Acanthoscelides obtectus TaxID=200917 RepID=A0A9P0PTR0_ACAOB|nr:unnamed protein product [Acanthoscelides obtectus]CAK1644091.1 Tetratricopeptide repeat protein 17 [Acanthoscelides obtectus]
MRLWKFYSLILLIFPESFTHGKAATHWVVTESGRIQPHLESPFNLRKPYDLVALLEQEARYEEINKLYKDLINRKEAIESKWSTLEGNSNVGLKITSHDPDCLAAGKLFSDIDLYANIVTNGTDRKGVVIEFSKNGIPPKPWEVPHCVKFSVLKKGYNNIPDVENNTNIHLSPDESLDKFIPLESLEVFGHEIAASLKKNTTSWVHYNLAAIFWRVKGDGDKAIDCIKRAIQYVPSEYQDIPLYNLAGILHQARHSKEAAMVLQKAIEIAPEQAIHYLAIGNVYAALGDYNKSVVYYDKFLEMNPGQKDVVANKHATLCYWKLEKGLLSFQESLQGILSDLHDYHSQQQQWLRLQERLMWEHASFEYQFEGLQNNLKFPGGMMQRCIQKPGENSEPVISCEAYDPPEVDHLNLQNIFQYVENEKQKIHSQINKASEEKFSSLENDEKKQQSSEAPPVLYPKFPTSMSTSGNQYFDVTGWPTKEDCHAWNLPVDEEEDLKLPLFLPPENKGYQVQKILSEYIGLPDGSQHDLPWYPPVCENPNVLGEKFIPPSERHLLNGDLKANEYLKHYLLKYVNDGSADEAEIGQRIITAMEKKTAPRWVLVTLASLYWRIRGNVRRTLDCLDAALQAVPREHTDAVLVSLGSVSHQLGLQEQAMKFAALAFKINYVEPSTNFLLASLHYANKNPLLAMYYMKNVLRADPNYYEGQAERLLRIWGCRIKLGGYVAAATAQHKDGTEGTTKETCSTGTAGTSGGTAFRGEGVVCSANGEQCKNAAIACYKKTGEETPEPSLKASLQCEGGPGLPHHLRHQQLHRDANLGSTIISSLLAAGAEGSGESEPDQSRLERLIERSTLGAIGEAANNAGYHMRLSLGDEYQSQDMQALGDFYVAMTEDPQSENLLHVYDKFGTYTLSSSTCKNVKIIHRFKYSTVWPSIVIRSLDLTPYLKPKIDNKKLEPHCTDSGKAIPSVPLNTLIKSILKHRLPSSPEKDLIELLGLMASDQKMSLKELGTRIGLALKEDFHVELLG